jgi:hypothetical protein
MDDFQIVVYVLLVIIYIISRVMKARRNVNPPESEDHVPYQEIEPAETKEIPKPYNPPVSQPVTFEDLLKEFTGYKEEESPVKDEPQVVREIKETVIENPYLKVNQPVYSKTTYKSYDDEALANYKTPVSYDDLYKGPERIVEADIAKQDENKGRFGTYSSYKQYDLHTAARFRKLLHDPLSIKDAIILKEILDRKYF